MKEERCYFPEEWPMRLEQIIQTMRSLEPVLPLGSDLSKEEFQARVHAKVVLKGKREDLFAEALAIIISSAPSSLLKFYREVQQEDLRLMMDKQEK
jgi:hypothetical protein